MSAPVFLGKCRGCKGAARLTLPSPSAVKRAVGYGRSEVVFTWTLPNGATARGERGRFFSPCLCGRHVEFRRVLGRVTEQPCGSRCTGATGHACDCACGGKNHGSAHG